LKRFWGITIHPPISQHRRTLAVCSLEAATTTKEHRMATEVWTPMMYLAEEVMLETPEGAPCFVLRDAHRFAVRLAENHGVPNARLVAWSRAYARRVDELGPDEFDDRCSIGM
jgi:hypothetical protein